MESIMQKKDCQREKDVSSEAETKEERMGAQTVGEGGIGTGLREFCLIPPAPQLLLSEAGGEYQDLF